jgi:hypothetical protein
LDANHPPPSAAVRTVSAYKDNAMAITIILLFDIIVI